MPLVDTAAPRRLKMARPIAQLRQGRTDWYRIENSADTDGTATVSIYDEIGYWGVSAADFAQALATVDATTIELHLNSPGGEIFDGIAIKNALEQHPATVNVTVDSLAASIASVIAMAGDTITMAPGSQMMIHDGSGLCIGNASDMHQMADLLDRQSDNIASIYAGRAGGTTADWRQTMQAETWYTAEEAVAAGLADKVLPGKKRTTAAPDQAAVPDNSWDLTIFRYAGRENAPAPRTGRLVAKAIAIHHTATVDTAWDGPAAVAAMPAEYADLHYCHAWQSADADASSHEAGDDDVDDEKSSFKFPHHAKKGGPANLPACRDGLARLEDSDIPDADKPGVKAHLQAHLDDANKADKPDDRAPVVHAALADEAEPTGTDVPALPGAVELTAPESTPATVTADQVEPATEAPAEPERAPEPAVTPEPIPVDTWAAAVARLTAPRPSPWTAAVAHLTTGAQRGGQHQKETQ